MKIKIEIKNRWTGDVLFSLGKRDNTVLRTLLEAIKSGANLRGADLSSADLHTANLSGADLSSADLSGADLSSADLHTADLSSADLSSADLRGANLYGANLYGANLYGADLYGADLSSANLRGSNLSSAVNGELAIARTRILPEGDIIGYKKCRDNIIVKLLIPKEAQRSHAFGRKCRAEYADVLEIFGAQIAYSQHTSSFAYEVGQRVKPEYPFSTNWQEECESGIHFYITKEEAQAHE